MVDLSDSTIAGQPELPQTIRCLLVSLHGATLLVPNSLIAEVVRGRVAKIEEAAGGGGQTLAWRGLLLPLVSLEPFFGLERQPDHTDTVAVFNTSSGDSRLPFFAVTVQGIPRGVRVTAKSLTSGGESSGGDASYLSVELDGETVLIPNIAGIETRLLEAGLSSGQEK